MSRLQKHDGAAGPAPRTIDDVAREQGITTPQDLDQMIGSAAALWDSDEEFKSFADGIRARRNINVPAK